MQQNVPASPPPHRGSWTRGRSAAALAALFLVWAAASPARAQEAGTNHALLVGGLGGDPAHTETFGEYLLATRQALVDAFGFPADQVVVLAEQRLQDEAFVDGVATAEEIRAQFTRLARRATPDDHVYVFLFGHGSYDGERAHLNIARRDLSDVDYAALVDALPAGRVVFVNTASASGPFAQTLSGPDRVVVTATRSGTERNETTFPAHFVAAMTDPAADLDKDGALSVREVFSYAARLTARSFEETGHLATEHAQLEDTGDGQAHPAEALEEAAEGGLASVTYLRRRTAALAEAGRPLDAAARGLLREKETVERAIAEVKSRKNRLDEDAYYAALEPLFVRLARLNDRLGL